MDDILLAHSCEPRVLSAYAQLQKELHNCGLVIAPDKIQQMPPYSYLGYCLKPQTIERQKLQIW